jgi:FkbM family methyltransferase
MQSYSWEGEDVLIRKIMLDVFRVTKGRYIDIGAYHPFNLSNTALLYSEGWRGINIDAMPESMGAFSEHRPEDINLEIAIAPVPGTRTYYRFANPAMNGFLDDATIQRHANSGHPVVAQSDIACMTINDVLAKYAPHSMIDLMCIDVEGLDCEILASFNFERWRPKAIVAEVLGAGALCEVVTSDVAQLLTTRSYMPFSRLHFSAVFLDCAAYANAAARG